MPVPAITQQGFERDRYFWVSMVLTHRDVPLGWSYLVTLRGLGIGKTGRGVR
jgi:hypothetical protein